MFSITYSKNVRKQKCILSNFSQSSLFASVSLAALHIPVRLNQFRLQNHFSPQKCQLMLEKGTLMLNAGFSTIHGLHKYLFAEVKG